jgi:stage V sporulation protein D (sporulation-specific penicillin-binding protein)
VEGQPVILGDYVEMTAGDGEKALKALGLSPRFIGSGETVTAQIPGSGQSVPAGSEVILYLGEKPAAAVVKIPDFIGMNRQQAADAAGLLGLYIQVTGNPEVSPYVLVTSQNIAAGTEMPAGTTVTLVFTDTKVRD